MFNLSQIISDYDLDKNTSVPMEKTQGNNSTVKKNRTLKRRLAKSDLNVNQPQPQSQPQSHPQPLTQDIYSSLDESDDNLADYPPKPQSSSIEMKRDAVDVGDNAVSENEYKLLGIGNDENQYAEKAYRQYLSSNHQWSPLLQQSQSQPTQERQQVQSNMNRGNENNTLLEKLNYMIHLLEDQQNEKTNNLTEELILYIFLGIFVIFVVDSFTKVGKYTR